MIHQLIGETYLDVVQIGSGFYVHQLPMSGAGSGCMPSV